jgi:ribokinase
MTCILTLGAEGAIVAGSGTSFSVDAASVTPLDTTGAGDTFVGVLAAGLDGGMDLRTSATRASLAEVWPVPSLARKPPSQPRQ